MDDVRRQLQMKENKKSKKRRIFQVFLLMICSAILYVSYAYDIWSYRFKANDDVKTDAGIVLGATSWNGKPSPVFKERINHAISLYKNGNIKKIILQVVQSSRQNLRKHVLQEYMQ